MFNYFFPVYSALWKIATPLLRCSSRLGQCWEQRTLQEAPRGPFDIWIQAASGGEASLANMVLDYLDLMEQNNARDRPYRILATATTPQGIKVLEKNYGRGNIDLTIRAFPLDAPAIMEKAYRLFTPRLAILVETELWPAFLACAKQTGVPVMVINGRMSSKSYCNYRKIFSFFSQFGPQRVLAMSQEDARRFGKLLGKDKVTTISNLKFDALGKPGKTAESIKKILPKNELFVIFGSIRKEEEIQIINCIHQLLHEYPTLVIGFFPKHIDRVKRIASKLSALNINYVLRSSLVEKAAPVGSVILWNQFGELASAYHYAEVAFVGGSLCPKGGHNLIEPLVTGIRPLTGPYWQDFAWIGEKAKKIGLIEQVENSAELTTALLNRLANKDNRKQNLVAIEEYLTAKQGGTASVYKEITRILH